MELLEILDLFDSLSTKNESLVFLPILDNLCSGFLYKRFALEDLLACSELFELKDVMEEDLL